MASLRVLSVAAVLAAWASNAGATERQAEATAICRASALAKAVDDRLRLLGRVERTGFFCACYGREVAEHFDDVAFRDQVAGRPMPNQAERDLAGRNARQLEAENRITPAVLALACMGDTLQ